jgi:hypothetical protein
MRASRRRLLLGALGALLLLPLAPFAIAAARTPSHDRAWAPDQAVLPWAEVRGRELVVHGVRNAVYRTVDDFDVRWEDRRYDLDALETVWFVVEPFGDWKGPAHTFLSFGFAGGEYLALSVEIRKEVGESFSPWRGLIGDYELMYVAGDERDLIHLRASHRRDEVYLYPIRARREQVEAMLLGMLERANELRRRPELYNTVTNNCTSNLARHVNAIVPGRVPLGYEMVLPGFSDQLAHRLGLIDTDLPFAQARERFRVDPVAQLWDGREDFSRFLREGEGVAGAQR